MTIHERQQRLDEQVGEAGKALTSRARRRRRRRPGGRAHSTTASLRRGGPVELAPGSASHSGKRRPDEARPSRRRRTVPAGSGRRLYALRGACPRNSDARARARDAGRLRPRGRERDGVIGHETPRPDPDACLGVIFAEENRDGLGALAGTVCVGRSSYRPFSGEGLDEDP
jgi:hypothetical protein